MKHVVVRVITAPRTGAIVTAVRIAALASLSTAIFALPAFSQEPALATWELNTPRQMPALRDLDLVAILALDAERARRDSASRQDASGSERRLPDVRVVDLRTEPHSRIGATIHFDVGTSTIRSDAVRTLEDKLDLLRGMPALRIRIEGQADVRDSSAYNIALAQQRAAAAKQWLMDRGIAANRIEAVGFGAWPQNRRDEFVIVAGADAGAQGRQ